MDTAFEFILLEYNSQHYCIICGCDIFGETNVQEHYNGKRHENALELYGSDISGCEGNRYNCSLCDCYISGYTNVRNHLTGNRHQSYMNDSESEDTESEDSESEDTESEDSEDELEYFILDPADFIVYNSDTEEWYCFICDYSSTHRHSIERHIQEIDHICDVKIYGEHIYGSETNWYHCSLCNCDIMSYKNVYAHITGRRHTNSL